MKIEQQDIRAALHGFLELLESADKQASVELLELWLGQLAFLQHFAGDGMNEAGDGPVFVEGAANHPYWRALIGEHFPALGEAAPTQGDDPVNDLAQIAGEISECLQRWQNLGGHQALWYFRTSYQVHWGRHLRSLQTHLHNLH